MDFDEQISLGHLLFSERKCRVCKETKNLINDFYKTRRNKSGGASSYSYECKSCTIERIRKDRKKQIVCDWSYPDW